MMNSELMQAKLKDPSLGVRAKSELQFEQKTGQNIGKF